MYSEVRLEEVGDLLHDLVVVVRVGQQVEANGGPLAVHKLDVVAVFQESLGVRQLPVTGEVEPGHDDEALGEGDAQEALAVGAERIAARVVAVGVLGQVRLPVPVPVLERDEVLAVEAALRLGALVAAEHGVQQDVAGDRDPLAGGTGGDVVGDVASGAVAGEEHAGPPVRPAAEARLRRDPLERGPAVVVRARAAVLGRAAVVDGHDDGAAAEPHQPAAQLVVDGRAEGRVHEAAAVEEDDDRERVPGRRAREEVEDGQGGRGRALGVGGGGGGAVDAGLEADRLVDDEVEGGDALHGARVGNRPAVEVLVEVAVEGAVGAAEHGVRHLESGDEDPCVDRHRHVRLRGRSNTVYGEAASHQSITRALLIYVFLCRFLAWTRTQSACQKDAKLWQ
jgi:hypothetical protein